jgi:SulP family sulfate permease
VTTSALISSVPVLSRANVSGLGRLGTGGGFGDVTRHAEHRKVSGLLVVRPNAELFLANVEGIRAAIVAAASEADPPARALLLDLEMTYEIDVPTADVLGEVIDELEGMEVGLMPARVHGKAHDISRARGCWNDWARMGSTIAWWGVRWAT